MNSYGELAMLSSFFEKKAMKRAIWGVLLAFKETAEEESNEFDTQTNLVYSIVWGSYIISQHENIEFESFFQLLVASVRREIIRSNNSINLETITFCASNLRGNFGNYSKEMGLFFGESARKLKLNVSIFNTIPIEPILYDELVRVVRKRHEMIISQR